MNNIPKNIITIWYLSVFFGMMQMLSLGTAYLLEKRIGMFAFQLCGFFILLWVCLFVAKHRKC